MTWCVRIRIIVKDRVKLNECSPGKLINLLENISEKMKVHMSIL